MKYFVRGKGKVIAFSGDMTLYFQVAFRWSSEIQSHEW